MPDRNNTVKRTIGYVFIVAVALVLFVGWRTTRNIASVEAGPVMVDDSIAETAVATAVVDLPILQSGEDLPVPHDTSLEPNLDPQTYQGQRPEHVFERYVVERGDTPGGIAERFGIRAETILGGNPQLSEESSLLQTGVELLILPIDGVLHDVTPGETLASVGQRYGVPEADIIAYAPNRLEFPYRLYPETQVLVPGGVRELFVWTPPTLASVGGTSSEGSGVRPLVVGTGTFIYPVSGRGFSQYFWYGHPGVDIALAEGSPAYAADTGTVTYAGWNVYGYGNLVVVNHGNGFETFYAHLSGFNVVPGQIVTKGQILGWTGNTGNSSGPHIHFEIRINNNRDNPCWYLGC